MLPSTESAPSTVACITGMHRCGTSFAASALRFLGVSLGDASRHMRPGADNPAGYFELQSVMELNEELLAQLGGAWDQPPVLDPGWEHDESLDSFRDRAREVLQDAFAAELAGTGAAVMAWKDPRLSLLLPFWRTVVPVAKTIVLVRSPVEVAASLGARKYAVSAPQSASLWMRYIYAAVANDQGHLMLRYTDFHDDLPATMTKIATHLGVEIPGEETIESVRQQLDPELRHHVALEISDGEAPDPLTAMALAVWNDGAVDLGALPDVVAQALARGWLRPPVDGELLARARAEAVRLRETLRAKNREEARAAPR